MTLLLEGEEALVPVDALELGDQIRIGDEWLTVTRIQIDRIGGRYLVAGGRTFHALTGAQRHARPGQEATQ